MSSSAGRSVWYLQEGWRLYKATWLSVLKAILFWVLLMAAEGILIAVAVVGVVVVGAFSGRHVSNSPQTWQTVVGGLTALALIVLVPPLIYLWYRLFSKDYFPGEYRLWRLFRQGFRYWPRIVKLNLWALLLFSPITALNLYLMFHGSPNLAALQHQTGRTWALLLTAPLTNVTAIYTMFAFLEVVRHDLPALTAWKKAFGLIRREDWLGTVGLLAGLGVVLTVISTVLQVSTPPGAFLLLFGEGVAGGLLWLYLSFCHLAVWHRASLPPSEAATATEEA